MKKASKPSLANKRKLFIITGIVLTVLTGLFLLSLTDNEQKPPFMMRNFELEEDEELAQLLTAVPDSDLVKFRCTIPFVNDGEDKFYWRLSYQHDMFDEVSDELFLTAIEEIKNNTTQSRLLLSGRFCETEDNRVVLDYYTANRESSIFGRGYYHGRDVEGFVTIVDGKGNLGTSIPFTSATFWTYTGCKPLFQMTKNDEFYLLCGITKTYTADSVLYKIDYPAKQVVPLYKCTYDRHDQFTKTCGLIN